jgi:hypothetical protein
MDRLCQWTDLRPPKTSYRQRLSVRCSTSRRASPAGRRSRASRSSASWKRYSPAGDPRRSATHPDMLQSRRLESHPNSLRGFQRAQNTRRIHSNIIDFSTFHKMMSLDHPARLLGNPFQGVGFEARKRLIRSKEFAEQPRYFFATHQAVARDARET